MTNEETKLLAQVSTKLETVIDRMTELSGKMDELQKTHVMEMNSRMAVAETKINRMEKVLYGTMAVVFVEVAAFIISILR